MDIVDVIRQIPVQFDDAMMGIIVRGAHAKRTIIQLWETRRDQVCETDFWQQVGKPLYERNIEPLQPFDYLLVGSSILLTIVALKICSVAAFPLCLGAGALAISCACAFSLYRIRKYFDRIAWNHVDEIRRIVHDMTHRNQRFDDINGYRAKLQQPEFDHLNEEFKELDKQLDDFRRAILAPNYEDKKKIVQAHLVHLKDLVQTNDEDIALIEALEEEVAKVGKKEQDWAALEKSKQELDGLETLDTDDAKSQLDELRWQINDLSKATTEGPILIDSKKALLVYLEGLQKKLAPEKDIEVLNELDEENERP